MAKDEQEIKDVLKEMLGGSRLKKGIIESRLKSNWPKIMGPAVHKHTNYINFKNGELTVKLNSAPLRQELSYGKEKIIKNINDFMEDDVVKTINIY